MMQELMRVDGGSEAVPFVRMFNGSPSEYLWEVSHGVVHTIPQGEGDPLMPLLFAVGQNQALEAVKGQLSDGNNLLAYLDDTFSVAQPESTGDSFRGLETELWNRAKIRIRPKYGIGQASDHQFATSLRKEPEPLIRRRSFGEGPRCHATSKV